jgi:hypothetical protein
VARALETEWEKRWRDLAAAGAELRQREQLCPRGLLPEEKDHLRSLGSDLQKVWTAPTTRIASTTIPRFQRPAEPPAEARADSQGRGDFGHLPFYGSSLVEGWFPRREQGVAGLAVGGTKNGWTGSPTELQNGTG